ncbi:MAG: NAD(P)/FAD-dependent oxidoreductase [Pseudomonadota bacterium]|nr:MAG: NAD(P)/FAD-dependent oxidoreductase [Pseudomonadota bacterium]
MAARRSITTEVVIIGASAAGLMCAIEAGKRRRGVIVLDHANKPGKKILMSGGGRCNFTNYHVEAENFISHNPHFCKSALSRFTQWDFIRLVERHRIAYHERDNGKLFCDNSAKAILNMLLSECSDNAVGISLGTHVEQIERLGDNHYRITARDEAGPVTFDAQSLVVATGGLSIPKMCASPLGYQIAAQFGVRVWPTAPGLVPFTLRPTDRERFAPLTGIAVDSLVSNARQQFRDNLLFTHRGLSGPAILQISSYWLPGESIVIRLLPDLDLASVLVAARTAQPGRKLKTTMGQYLPRRLVAAFFEGKLIESHLQSLSDRQIAEVAARLQNWSLTPGGTEGYRTAEVTRGGVDCDALSSKTMEAQQVPGLYFIGEVVDVTGWLGGYNFQWAWASGWCAGQYV